MGSACRRDVDLGGMGQTALSGRYGVISSRKRRQESPRHAAPARSKLHRCGSGGVPHDQKPPWK